MCTWLRPQKWSNGRPVCVLTRRFRISPERYKRELERWQPDAGPKRCDSAASPSGLAGPFPPFGAVLLSKDEGFVVGCDAVAAGSESEGQPAAAPSTAEKPFADAG